jgi:hypothetical protein
MMGVPHGTDHEGDTMSDVQDRLAALASSWAGAAAGFVPVLPVRPASAVSYEPHVLSTICVEIVLPLAATAPQWDPEKVDKRLGRIDMKLRHLESIGAQVERDLGLDDLIAETRELVQEQKVRSTIGKHMGKAPPYYYESSIGADEAVVAERALRALSTALAQGDGGSLRSAGTLEYRFRDGPGVLAFWSMKVEVGSPGIKQKFSLRIGRGRQGPAIADSLTELLERLHQAPGDMRATERHVDLVELCEISLRDLGRDPATADAPASEAAGDPDDEPLD